MITSGMGLTKKKKNWIFSWVQKQVPQALANLGGSGGMLPRENFDISSAQLCNLSVSEDKIHCLKRCNSLE